MSHPLCNPYFWAPLLAFHQNMLNFNQFHPYFFSPVQDVQFSQSVQNQTSIENHGSSSVDGGEVPQSGQRNAPIARRSPVRATKKKSKKKKSIKKKRSMKKDRNYPDRKENSSRNSRSSILRRFFGDLKKSICAETLSEVPFFGEQEYSRNDLKKTFQYAKTKNCIKDYVSMKAINNAINSTEQVEKAALLKAMMLKYFELRYEVSLRESIRVDKKYWQIRIEDKNELVEELFGDDREAQEDHPTVKKEEF